MSAHWAGHMGLHVLQEMPGLVGEVHQDVWHDEGVELSDQPVLAVGADAHVAADHERVGALVIDAHPALHAHSVLLVLQFRLLLLLKGLGDGGILVVSNATLLRSVKQPLRQCI